jgi:hypothetical protein
METSTGIIDYDLSVVWWCKNVKTTLQEVILFFQNPASQKSHVKAFTYKYSDLFIKTDCRLPFESK